MPHTTFAYWFEAKVSAWAGDLSQARTGTLRPFLLTLVPDAVGNPFTLDFHDEAVQSVRERHNTGGTPFLFFDPVDAPEYTWLEWQGILRPVMERLLGQAFVDADFISLKDGRQQPYPETLGVMF